MDRIGQEMEFVIFNFIYKFLLWPYHSVIPLNLETQNTLEKYNFNFGSKLDEKLLPLADLRGGGPRDAPPGGPNSFIFIQFLAKKLQNNLNSGVGALPSGKILDPSLIPTYQMAINEQIS